MPATAVRITRMGAAVLVADASDRPLPEEITSQLIPHLRYTYRRYLRGMELRQMPRGSPPFVTEQRLLHSFDKDGRLWCPAGYTLRLISHVANMGLEVEHVLGTGWDASAIARVQPDWAALERNPFDFRARQFECLSEIVAAISNCVGGVVDAAAGFGKTEIMVLVARIFPHAKIAIVVPGRDLVEETHRRLVAKLGAVGRVGGGKASSFQRITVYSADSVHKCPRPDEVDILIGDEAHSLVNESRVVALNQHMTRAVRVGLTATTTGRHDGSDSRIEATFGACIFVLSQSEAADLGVVMRIHVRWHRVYMREDPIATAFDPVIRKRLGLWLNATRNDEIARVAREYPDDEQTLIMVETVQHGIEVARRLPEFRLFYSRNDSSEANVRAAVDAGILGEDRVLVDAERSDIRRAFVDGNLKKVIATFTWKQGISPDSLSSMIWAAGGSSKIAATQGPSRASRVVADGGKATPILDDFSDDFNEAAHRQAMTRRKFYLANGWTQEGLPQRSSRLYT